ncbi:hypothetical protein Tco_0747668 [Tanacetum coccineum]|uniref:Uncharacterized protein n=1 Tax=Tanacetum coccineum TaxID=301880 RepID=A0ABQ4YW51_9ASTR
MERNNLAFKCTCEKGDVVLRTSRKHNTMHVLVQRRQSFSLGPSTPPNSSLGPSTRPSYSPLRSTLNLGKVECSNCNFLAEKIKALEMKIKIQEGTLVMERHPENTLESTAILHELYNDIGKLGLD